MTGSGTGERILKNRKRRASKGRTIRLSDDVLGELARLRADGESMDRLMRRILHLPDRYGNLPDAAEGWVEPVTGIFYFEESEAWGAAVVEAARAGTKKVQPPVRVREVIG